MRPHIVILLLILSIPCVLSWQVVERDLLRNGSVSCPLNFGILRKLGRIAEVPNFDTAVRCQFIRQALVLVQAEYLRVKNSFVPPLDSAESCWADYQTVVNKFIPYFDVGDMRRACGFQTSWIAQGCLNITTRADFETLVPRAVRNDLVSSCTQSLENATSCANCTTRLSRIQSTYLTGPSIGNISGCVRYPVIYTAASVDTIEVFGPFDQGIAKCLFSIDDSPSRPTNKQKPSIIYVFAIVCPLIFAVGISVFCYLRRKRKRNLRKKFKSESALAFPRSDSIGGSTTLIKFTFDEIKAATKNFSRENIIGRGGFGNVYKGVLPDGSEVALKRFKNASAPRDANFTHEVEVIASIHHVNLVALRGFCAATTELEGHQRIIVCDLMKKGSLYDHLFGGTGVKLSWHVRQKIALGTANGLAYLHYGAQPKIIHRDIKARNILLDERFEAKVADFGLAKFTPEGMSHLSTRVAGTMGYVAPEYALYGQLTERSDVYSFGIVLLELLSGKKALLAVNDGQAVLLNDWAWSLVREDRTLDVIDGTMPDLGPPEVMEKYVLIAVLCSHPQLYARPTMDQVVKMLDTKIPVPSIPNWPLPLNEGIDYIEKSVSVGGSGHLSTAPGYQPFMPRGNSKSSLS